MLLIVNTVKFKNFICLMTKKSIWKGVCGVVRNEKLFVELQKNCNWIVYGSKFKEELEPNHFFDLFYQKNYAQFENCCFSDDASYYTKNSKSFNPRNSILNSGKILSTGVYTTYFLVFQKIYLKSVNCCKSCSVTRRLDGRLEIRSKILWTFELNHENKN